MLNISISKKTPLRLIPLLLVTICLLKKGITTWSYRGLKRGSKIFIERIDTVQPQLTERSGVADIYLFS